MLNTFVMTKLIIHKPANEELLYLQIKSETFGSPVARKDGKRTKESY